MNAILHHRHLDHFPEILDAELLQASPCHICTKENGETCNIAKEVVLPPFKNYRDVQHYQCNAMKDKTITDFYSNTILRTFSMLYCSDNLSTNIDPEVFVELKTDIFKPNPRQDLLRKILQPEYQKFLGDFVEYVKSHPDIYAWEVVFEVVSMLAHLRILALLKSDSQQMHD